MAKRFTDTNKYKKPFVRSLPGPYKLLWDFLYHDCDNAGIWIVDFETAQIYVGKDMPVSMDKALELFNQDEVRVVPIDGGQRWFLPGFIDFQYGQLKPENRAHTGVITTLQKFGLLEENYTPKKNYKPLTSPFEGAKDKDKDKDKETEKEKDSASPLSQQVEDWTHAAIEGDDPVLEQMEMKDAREIGGKWPSAENRTKLILDHRDLCARYAWRFESQQQFRHSLLKVLRESTTRQQPHGNNTSKKQQQVNELVADHQRRYGS